MRKETKATCFLICSTDQGNEWIYGRRLTYSTTAKKKKKTLLELRFALSPAWRCHALHPCIYVCTYTQAIHSIVLGVFVCASPDCYVVALVLEKEENLVFPRFDSLLFIGWNISYTFTCRKRWGKRKKAASIIVYPSRNGNEGLHGRPPQRKKKKNSLRAVFLERREDGEGGRRRSGV